jgi:uncharacterized membrane protein
LFRSYALDYGFYNQVFWKIAHFKQPNSTVFEPNIDHFCQVHPSFTLYILSPLYWVFNWLLGTYTLLFIQNIFIVLGSLGTYLFIKKKTNDLILSFLAILHFNFIWGHYSAISFEYIDATIASSMVPFFFYFFEKSKYGLSLLILFFTFFARENFPIWGFFIGLFLFIENIKDTKKRNQAILIAVCSILYLILAFKVFIPYFENPNLPYWGFAYSKMGENFGGVFVFLFSHPLEAFKMLFINHSGDPTFDGIKLELYMVMLFSGGFIIYHKKTYFLLFIPIIAQKVWNDDPVRWGINIFYSIEIVSIFSLAIFSSLFVLKSKTKQYIIGVLICIFTLHTTLEVMNDRTSKWYHPEKEKFYVSEFYKYPDNFEGITEILNKVPSDVSISTTTPILPHLAYRDTIYLFPNIRKANYLLLPKVNTNPYPLSETDYNTQLVDYKKDTNWLKVFENKDAVLLKRKK